jgi:hypothetical protein
VPPPRRSCSSNAARARSRIARRSARTSLSRSGRCSVLSAIPTIEASGEPRRYACGSTSSSMYSVMHNTLLRARGQPAQSSSKRSHRRKHHPSGSQPVLCRFVSISMTAVSNDPATGGQPSALMELNEILALLGEPVTTREELERAGIDVDDE